ncbi:DUF2510 domain-containing protein [Georgenia sp. AZ-5]|uniref:DUF2510 domain-containing protein n=1 Tax=Georgenia sp. AZ-5 TaxID=3367526 RepID=UPI003754F235
MPSKSPCACCGGEFIGPTTSSDDFDLWDDTFPDALLDVVCEVCLQAAGKGDAIVDDNFTQERFLDQLRRLDHLVGRLPVHGGWRREIFFRDVPLDRLVQAVTIAGDMPTIRKVRWHYGSWAGALVAAGVAEPDTRENSRGIQSRATDGHLCYSLGELLIDDWLTANEIDHEREPRYPDSDLRADFLVGDLLIEFLGLAGNAEYDAITERKRRLAKEYDLRLFEINQMHIKSWSRTSDRLAQALGITSRTVQPAPPSVGTAPPSTRYIRLADARAAALEYVPLTREPGWYPDPFGVGYARFHDGRWWTRKVQTSSGYHFVHTPSVSLAVARETWEIMDDEDRRFELWDRLAEITASAGKGPVPTPVLEWLLAWMDAGENHVVKCRNELLARGEEPWSGLQPWREPYKRTIDLFVVAGMVEAELAIRIREAEVRPRTFRTRELKLLNLGYIPDDLAAGLVVPE